MKRVLKFLVLLVGAVAAGGLLLAGAGIAYLSRYDNEDWKHLAIRVARVAAGCELRVDGGFSLEPSWHPSLTMNDFSLTPAQGGGRFGIPHGKRLELKVDLPRLLHRVLHVEHARLDGVEVYLKETRDEHPEPSRRGVGRPRWAVLVSEAQVAESRFVYHPTREPSPTSLALDSLSFVQDAAGDTVEISGAGSVNGYHAELAGRVGSVEEFLQPTRPYPLHLSAELRGARFTVDGTVERPAAGTGLALDITAESADLAEVLRLLRRDWPALGSLKASARLSGGWSAMRLEALSVAIEDGRGSGLLCNGSVADLSRGTGVDLRFAATVLDTARFRALYGVDLPNLDRVAGKGRVVGSGGTLRVEELVASVQDGDLTAEVKGTVGALARTGPVRVRDVDLAVSARIADLSTWSPLAGRRLPALGPATIGVRIRDRQDALELAGVDLRLGPSEQAQVRITGAVKRVAWQPRFSAAGVDLHVDGRADSVSHLLVGGPGDLPLQQAALASGEITDADGSLGLEGALLQVGSEDTGVVRVQGGIDDLEHLRDADLTVEVRLPDLRALATVLRQAHLLERDLPALGPVNGTMEIRDRDGRFGADKIDFRIGSRPGTWVRLAGRVGDLVARKAVALKLEAAAQSLAGLGFLAGRPLPDLGPVEASGELSETGGSFGLERLSVAIGSPGGEHVRATGRVPDLRTLRGSLLDLDVSLKDLALLEAFARRRLPRAGPVTGTLKLVSDSAGVSAREIDLHLGSRDTLWADVRGRVGDVEAFREVELSASAGAAALTLLEPALGRKLPDIGAVAAVARVADRDGKLRLEEFRVTGGASGGFVLELTGDVDDLRSWDALAFDLRLKAQDLSGFAALMDVPLPQGGPISLGAHFAGSRQRGRLEPLELSIGRTRLSGEASYTRNGDKPDVVARLTSPLAYAADFYGKRSPAGAPAVAAGQGGTGGLPSPRPPRRQWLFNDDPLPLDRLHRANLDFTLEIDELYAGAVHFDGIKATLELRDGHLEAKLLETLVHGGKLAASLDVDGRADPPRHALVIEAHNWSTGILYSEFVGESQVQGQLDGKVDVQGRGRSLREIVAGLDGEIVAVMGGGTLRGIAIDRLAANLFDQLGLRQDPRTTPVNCSVEHLKITNGLATAETLLLDTDVSTVRGSGTIDMRRERIDIRLVPQPKQPKLATIKTPVTIRGDLADPTVTVESASSFLKTLAKAVGLGIVNPFAAVIPFLSTGSLEHHPCAPFLKEGLQAEPHPPGSD